MAILITHFSSKLKNVSLDLLALFTFVLLAYFKATLSAPWVSASDPDTDPLLPHLSSHNSVN